MRRVAITGIGIVSSIGNTKEEVADSLRESRSGIVASQEYTDLGFRSRVHAPVTLDWEAIVDRRASRFLADGTASTHQLTLPGDRPRIRQYSAISALDGLRKDLLASS